MTITLSPTTSNSPPVARAIYINFLEGLRGLAALYVVLFHLFGNSPVPYPTAWLRFITGWTHYGGYAVDVFIVLSGYCIMIPVARSPDGELRGGFRGFMKRRAKRILPPYYAALFLGLLLATFVPARLHSAAADHTNLFNISGANLFSHLALVHNVKAAWAQSIDPPMWSVATEWQIYFLFPPLLLPVWRRFGNGAVVLTAFLVGLIPIVLSHGRWFWWASPWFVGLYAMGMAGAAIQFQGGEARAAWRDAVPWRLLSIGLFTLVCLLSIGFPPSTKYPYVILIDLLVGALTVTLIASCANPPAGGSGRPSLARRILESHSVLALGAFSYSLYLVHFFAITYVCAPLSAQLSALISLTSPIGFLMDAAVKLTIILGFAYLFYRIFERPFVTRKT